MDNLRGKDTLHLLGVVNTSGRGFIKHKAFSRFFITACISSFLSIICFSRAFILSFMTLISSKMGSRGTSWSKAQYSHNLHLLKTL